MEPGPIRVRLSLMMFGQYLILGAWAVPFATYLLTKPDQGGLGFSPGQTSWIYSTTAIAALVAPLLLGLLADRLFAAQKLLAILHLIGAALLFVAARFCSQTQEELQTASDPAHTRAAFAVLMPLMVGISFITILTLSLCNVTGFRNLREPKKSFGGVRLFGTVAWIVVNVAIDWFGSPISAQPLYVAAVGSLVMGIYAFTLPHTPPARLGRGVAEAMGVPALKMFADPGFRILVGCALFMAAVQQFYTIYANKFLYDLGAAKPTALQTIAQASEIVCLLLFPLVLARYGFRLTLAIGVLGWVIRNALFATAWLPLIAVVGLPLHGMCFTFFFVVTNLFVDRHAPPHLRASAQGIVMFAVSGFGTLLGNLLSARVLEATATDGHVVWSWFWLVPAAASAVVFLFFTAGFRDSHAVPVTSAPGQVTAAPATV